MQGPCPYACIHAATGKRVSALQITGKPPRAAPPAWALAAKSSGLLEVEGDHLVLWGPRGPQGVPLLSWLVWAEGVLGLQCVSPQVFQAEFVSEIEDAAAA